jgi:hypothetical protein
MSLILPASAFPIFWRLENKNCVQEISFLLAMSTSVENRLLPLELVDKCIKSRIWIILKSEREIVGTLVGFDEFVSKCVQAAL